MEPAAAMAILLILTVRADAAERLVAKSHRAQPDWVAKPPDDSSAGMTYFVGAKDKARTLREGRDGAYHDATGQAAGFIQTKVSGRYSSRRTEEEAAIVDEMRSAARGNVVGARILDVYWERYLDSGWFAREEHFRVWALVGIPQTEITRERKRLQDLRTALQAQLEELCRVEAAWMLANAKGDTVVVAGFHEAASNKAYSFSRIVEERLSGCLSEKGARVVQSDGQDILSSGSYYRIGGDAVAITGSLIRMADGAKLFAKTVTFPDDAIEPSWLRVEEPGRDEFFAGLERWETKRALAVGKLAVDSTPRGARVLLDGEDRGKTPVEIPEVPVGSHGVVMALSGHDLHSETIRVQPEQTLRLEATLRLKTGAVALVTTPPAAAVFVDGRRAGLTPVELRLPAGPHAIAFRLEHYRKRDISLMIPNKGKLERSEILEEEPGGLAVISDPEGADVYVDDEEDSRGRTPIKIDHVEAGRHVVHLAKPGYGGASVDAVIHANRYAQVSETLERTQTGQVIVSAEPAGARLWIDDEEMPDGAMHGGCELPPGKHTVRLEKDGYRRWTGSFKIRPGRREKLKVRLKPVAYSGEGAELAGTDVVADDAGTEYLDLLGGFASLSNTRFNMRGNRRDVLAGFHVLKYMRFFPALGLGLGASAFDSYSGPWNVTVQKTSLASSESTRQTPEVLCLFPLHLMAAPLGRRRWLGNTVGAPMLYYNFSAWSYLQLKDAPDPSAGLQPWNAVTHDAGVQVPLGHWMALKAGYFQLKQSAFSISRDEKNQRRETVTTRWQVSDINDHRWYVALELHLGGMR